jgi:GAF domain-containing protein
MKCPRCQQENPSQAKFCLECGAPVDGATPIPKSYADLKGENADLKGENEGLRRSLGGAHAQVTEALEQQTATAEILRAISSSPTDVQPVVDTIAAWAAKLCEARHASVLRFDGELVHLVALHNMNPEGSDVLRNAFPMPLSGEAWGVRAIRTRQVIHVPDVLEDQALAGLATEWTKGARLVGARAGLAVPMVREAQTVGAIVVLRPRPGRFTDKQIELLQTFADQAVIAIENVRLFKELTAKNDALTEALEQQTATSEILQVISQSPTEVQPVFETIVRNAVRLCGGVHGGVYHFDGQLVHSAAHDGYTPEELESWRKTWPRPVSAASAACQAIRTKTVARIADIETSPELSGLSPEARANLRMRGSRSVVAVPIRRKDDVIGAIGVTHGQVDGFSGAHVELLRTFADQAVIAIENVRLFTELQEKNRALTQAHAQVTESLEQQTATSEILRVIASSPTDVQPVFDTIAASASRLCGGVAAIVTRFDGEMIHLVAHHNPRPGIEPITARLYPRRPGRDTTVARAILECSIVHIPDAEKDPDLAPNLARDVRAGSFLAVPMLRDGQPIGAISVSRVETGAFLAGQVELLKTFADQAVIAIENVRLFTELQASNRELTLALDTQTATSDILRVISRSQTDVQPVFEAIADSAMRLFGAWSAAVWRYDGEYLVVAAARGGRPGSSEAMLGRWPPRRPADAPFTGRTVSSRTVQQIVDAETDPTLEPVVREGARERGWRTTVQVPMLRGDDVVGVIGVTRAEPGGFSPAEIALLQTFADQAVIAIENARLLTELQARTTELQRSVGQLTALGEVGQAVSSSLDLETVLTTIVSRAVQLSGLEGGVIFEYDESAEEFVQRATTQTGGLGAAGRAGVRKGEGVVGRTAVTLEPVQVPDIQVAGAYESRLRETLVESGVRALLAVPIIREGRVLGGLAVSRTRPGEFPPEIVELLRTFATQSALAIQNARLYQEIEDKSRQLEAASQHKSEFLANMSHELRTPLNAIIGFSEVLSERMFGELNEKQEEYLKDIHASGQHLLSLINDILDLSKIEAGRMELELTDFNLPTTLDNALTLVRERAGRHGIELHMAVDERLGQIRADERKIRQVVLNLLSNAIKFTPGGGRIDVRTVPGDGVIEVSVSDTGVGIAPEDQEAIFEEFRQVGTAAKKVEGTGLGLALSRKFIELHGGRIWVESQVGVGSTFTFRIPVSRGE